MRISKLHIMVTRMCYKHCWIPITVRDEIVGFFFRSFVGRENFVYLVVRHTTALQDCRVPTWGNLAGLLCSMENFSPTPKLVAFLERVNLGKFSLHRP